MENIRTPYQMRITYIDIKLIVLLKLLCYANVNTIIRMAKRFRGTIIFMLIYVIRILFEV